MIYLLQFESHLLLPAGNFAAVEPWDKGSGKKGCNFSMFSWKKFLKLFGCSSFGRFDGRVEVFVLRTSSFTKMVQFLASEHY